MFLVLGRALRGFVVLRVFLVSGGFFFASPVLGRVLRGFVGPWSLFWLPVFFCRFFVAFSPRRCVSVCRSLRSFEVPTYPEGDPVVLWTPLTSAQEMRPRLVFLLRPWDFLVGLGGVEDMGLVVSHPVPLGGLEVFAWFGGVHSRSAWSLDPFLW